MPDQAIDITTNKTMYSMGGDGDHQWLMMMDQIEKKKKSSQAVLKLIGAPSPSPKVEACFGLNLPISFKTNQVWKTTPALVEKEI